jgi:hypothetical protein
MPVTGWELWHAAYSLFVWRHRCVRCGDEIFEDARGEGERGVQLLELLNRYGTPPLCLWCQFPLFT